MFDAYGVRLRYVQEVCSRGAIECYSTSLGQKYGAVDGPLQPRDGLYPSATPFSPHLLFTDCFLAMRRRAD